MIKLVGWCLCFISLAPLWLLRFVRDLDIVFKDHRAFENIRTWKKDRIEGMATVVTLC